MMRRRWLLCLLWVGLAACARPTPPNVTGAAFPPYTPTTPAVSPGVVTATPLPTAASVVTPPPASVRSLGEAGAFVIMGDSWAAQLGMGLEAALQARGFAGHYYAIGAGGSTTALWLADAEERLTRVKRILSNEDANGAILLLFLGGNDLLDGYLAEGPAILTRIQTNLRDILNVLHTAGPQTHIFISSYDFFPQLCQTPLGRAGLTTPGAANSILLQMGSDYADLATDNLTTYLDLWGTLPGAGTGGTREQQWSDNAYFRDCAHPNSQGFQRFGAALLDKLEATLSAP